MGLHRHFTCVLMAACLFVLIVSYGNVQRILVHNDSIEDVTVSQLKARLRVLHMKFIHPSKAGRLLKSALPAEGPLDSTCTHHRTLQPSRLGSEKAKNRAYSWYFPSLACISKHESKHIMNTIISPHVYWGISGYGTSPFDSPNLYNIH
jgi:hypothetical protein